MTNYDTVDDSRKGAWNAGLFIAWKLASMTMWYVFWWSQQHRSLPWIFWYMLTEVLLTTGHETFLKTCVDSNYITDAHLVHFAV